jgi:hypothetical protein
VETIDEAIALLTGVPAGQRDELGRYPAASINHRVETRLTELSELRRAFGQGKGSDTSHE